MYETDHNELLSEIEKLKKSICTDGEAPGLKEVEERGKENSGEKIQKEILEGDQKLEDTAQRNLESQRIEKDTVETKIDEEEDF